VAEVEHGKTGSTDAPDVRSPIAQIPFWKKALVVGSIVLMIAGGVLTVMASGGEERAPAGQSNGSGSPELAMGLGANNGDGGVQTTGAKDDAEPAWSSAMFKLGFSFFVGFAVAFALRTFIKLSIVVIGVFLLIQFALAHYGFIEIHWDVFSRHYDSVGDWLGRQFESLKAFMNGALPSGTSAIAGMVMGFRKG
jgi:uncharacterized membrane protein (Fun14 family)